MNREDMHDMLSRFYDTVNSSPELAREAEEYSERHGIESAGILTVYEDEIANLIHGHLEDRIRGKVVIEIGAGIGLLALHLSATAEKVLAIEANPMWNSVWVAFLHKHKPKNVTWIFGAADEVAGMIRGDVALFCTHSDHDGMAATARLFAPEVIDVYREIQGGLTSEEYLQQHPELIDM